MPPNRRHYVAWMNTSLRTKIEMATATISATASPSSLLTTLTESLKSATSSFPAVQPDTLSPPSADGISLLDTKNDLLLSYLQNLVFLVILKLRHPNGGPIAEGDSGDGGGTVVIGDEVVRKLIETRVYLEKGVRPLEGRLRYQIEKVVRAAEVEAERSAAQSKNQLNGRNEGIANGIKGTEASDASDSDADSTSSEDTTASHENGTQPKIDDLSYRPNPSALLRKSQPSESVGSPSRSSTTTAYKPPRITPTSMPTTATDSASRSTLQHRKSHLLDEYISTELSSAPHAEPSIGSNSTVLNRGRGALSTRERDKERERTEYEERNFSRLPRESKAERRKNRVRDGGNATREKFGGEDWTGLGEVGDRVVRSVGREGRGKGGVLERREKRRRESGNVGDNGGGGRVGIGESFDKRRKIMEARAEKKRKGR